MSERRFNDREVADIFANAADAQELGARRPGTSGTGMTLREIQEIGDEAGIAPDAVARAAAMVGLAATPVEGRLMGLPIRVGETVDLGRRLTEDEWDQLVVDLRETFDARGKVDASGNFRQWTNGNLQALLEPTPAGHRLRLQTYNQQSRAFIGLGVAVAGVSVASLFVAAIGHALSADSLSSLGSLFLVGAAMSGIGGARLPSWSRKRREQMRGVIARIKPATDLPSAPDESNS